MTSKISQFRGEYRWLSNFVDCLVCFEGRYYPTVEHAYQAAKTLDDNYRSKFTANITAGQAKRLGKDNVLKEKGILRSDWDKVRLDVMRHLLSVKFSKKSYKDKLLATGDAIIEEGNRWGDVFWGVDLKTGEGQNKMGKMIMDIRETIKGNN